MFKHLGYLVILIAAWADQYWSLPQNRQETFDLLKRERFWPKSSSPSANEFVSSHRVWAALNVTSQDKKAPRGTGLPHIHPKQDVPSRAHTYIYHVEITLPSIEQCRVIVSLVGERVQLHGVRMLPGTHKSLPHPPVYLSSVHSWLPTYLCSRITNRKRSILLGYPNPTLAPLTALSTMDGLQCHQTGNSSKKGPDGPDSITLTELRYSSQRNCGVSIWLPSTISDFPGSPVVKKKKKKKIHLPMQEMQEKWVRFLGQEDSLEEGIATHSSILAWNIPRTEEPGRLQSIVLQRAGPNWACMHVQPWKIQRPWPVPQSLLSLGQECPASKPAVTHPFTCKMEQQRYPPPRAAVRPEWGHIKPRTVSGTWNVLSSPGSYGGHLRLEKPVQ